MDDAVRDVIDREMRLLRPEVRSSRRQVDELLHPDFFEFGASGRGWDRGAMVEMLVADDGEAIDASEVSGTRLTEGVVLVTYVARSGDRRSRRSALWRETEDGSWRVYFHQGR